MGWLGVVGAVVVLVAGCSEPQPQAVSEPVHEPEREPERAPNQEPNEEPHQEPKPVLVQQVADVVPVEPAPEPPAEVKPRTTRVQAGVGRCRVDEDCVLTGYREGCCAPSCERYAISKVDLSARQARENCDAYRSGNKVCRPPAPCPRPTTRAVGVRCVNRTCSAVLELIAEDPVRVPIAPKQPEPELER